MYFQSQTVFIVEILEFQHFFAFSAGIIDLPFGTAPHYNRGECRPRGPRLTAHALKIAAAITAVLKVNHSLISITATKPGV